MTPEKRATILLADDPEAALVQATRMLGETYEIVGTTANGLELLAASARLDPDVIVLDIAMPGLDGLEAARRLKARGCRSRLVFLTVWADADYVREALGHHHSSGRCSRDFLHDARDGWRGSPGCSR